MDSYDNEWLLDDDLFPLWDRLQKEDSDHDASIQSIRLRISAVPAADKRTASSAGAPSKWSREY